MALTHVPLRIAQISDIHCGTLSFEPRLMESTIDRINRMRPDLVIVAGDLTADGYEWEYQEAADYLGRIDAPQLVVPGNHDARNIGYLHFERLFGERFTSRRIAFDGERAERLGSTGVTVVGVDSSQPDLNGGHVGREWYGWIREQFSEPGDIKIFVTHHHLVSVPATGRERSTIVDAGDLLQVLTELQLDIALSGHKHVPFFWGLNGMLVCNSGTACTRRVRGLTPPTWNEMQVDASTIKVYLHYEDERRGFSMIRTRADRAAVRDAFLLTDAFRASNRTLVD